MLSKIVAQKREEVDHKKKTASIARLQEQIARRKPALDIAPALTGERIRVIAEVKQASPSHGIFNQNLNHTALALTYAECGAAAISVLTEGNYFMGSIEHLAAIREVVNLPLLRKDFIFDPYQVYESRACGADALLLIAAVLSQQQLQELMQLSHSLGMKCLIEVHTDSEVERAIRSQADIIGINNRDLNTFVVDINVTRRLRPLVPEDRLVVSESGIRSRKDIEKLARWGVDAVLIGEALVTARDVRAKMKELLS